MEEIRGLTARLGVTQRQALDDGSNADVKALSIRSSEPVDAYKKDLVKAKEETLPDLFEKIKKSNEMMSTWMQVKLIPYEAEAAALQGSIGLVKDRIFSVQLYAGWSRRRSASATVCPLPTTRRSTSCSGARTWTRSASSGTRRAAWTTRASRTSSDGSASRPTSTVCSLTRARCWPSACGATTRNAR